MIITNQFLRPEMPFEYPKGNKIIFEQYFYNKFVESQTETDRIYLPIFWTPFYIQKEYGKGDISSIQNFLNSLDHRKKYYTIVQYDDNILNDLTNIDILIFCQGGHGKYRSKSYPIPLNCQIQSTGRTNLNRDIFASFVGGIAGRHHIREKMQKSLINKNDYFISESLGYDHFLNTMSRSTFSLCPRGYGQTSFRICESLFCGSIPVYIYDDPLIPFQDQFDFHDIGILIDQEDIKQITDILESKTQKDIDRYLVNGQKIYADYFSYSGCYNQILNILEKPNHDTF